MTQVTPEQAEAVHQCGGDVWYRFPHWPDYEYHRASHCSEDSPEVLRAAGLPGGRRSHVGVPTFFVEVE